MFDEIKCPQNLSRERAGLPTYITVACGCLGCTNDSAMSASASSRCWREIDPPRQMRTASGGSPSVEIAASADLHERELIKMAKLLAALASALRDRRARRPKRASLSFGLRSRNGWASPNDVATARS